MSAIELVLTLGMLYLAYRQSRYEDTVRGLFKEIDDLWQALTRK